MGRTVTRVGGRCPEARRTSGLKASGRFLARYLGPHGIRVNLVAAGAVRTLAAGGVLGLDEAGRAWNDRTPLGWNVEDAGPVARACVSLLSDWWPATTGEVVHVDGGVFAMGE